MTRLVLCLSVIFLALITPATGASNPSKLLLKTLLADYDSRLIPILQPSGKIEVHLKFLLGRIESLDEKRQILTSFGWLLAGWRDQFLQWDPRQHQGISKLDVPANTVWLPEIAMINSVSQGEDISFNSKFRVSILADGSVAWAPAMKWETSCRVDLTYFPYDHQTCNISFASWVYTSDQLDFIINSTEFFPFVGVSLEMYQQNAEWTLTSVRVTKLYIQVDEALQRPSINIILNLSRKPRYFVMNVVLPSVIITLLSVLVYWLPCESGEKISLAVTVFLSYTVLLLIVSDVTPRNGDSMALLTVYLLFGMVLTGLSLFGAIWVLTMHHHPPSRPVPQFVRTTLLRFLPRCFGTNAIDRRRVNNDELTRPDSTAHTEQNEGNDVAVADADYIRACKQKMAEESRMEAIRHEWQMCARILDNCHLVFFSIVVVITTVTLFAAIS